MEVRWIPGPGVERRIAARERAPLAHGRMKRGCPFAASFFHPKHGQLKPTAFRLYQDGSTGIFRPTRILVEPVVQPPIETAQDFALLTYMDWPPCPRSGLRHWLVKTIKRDFGLKSKLLSKTRSALRGHPLKTRTYS